MAEYIEREATCKGCVRYGMGETLCADCVVKVAPAADVAPVVHGRWEEADDGDGVVCSVCGEDFCTIYLETERFNYCPNCGCRMDKDGE